MPFSEPPQAPRLPICAICREPVRSVSAHCDQLDLHQPSVFTYECHGARQIDRVYAWDIEAYAVAHPELYALFGPTPAR